MLPGRSGQTRVPRPLPSCVCLGRGGLSGREPRAESGRPAPLPRGRRQRGQITSQPCGPASPCEPGRGTARLRLWGRRGWGVSEEPQPLPRFPAPTGRAETWLPGRRPLPQAGLGLPRRLPQSSLGQRQAKWHPFPSKTPMRVRSQSSGRLSPTPRAHARSRSCFASTAGPSCRRGPAPGRDGPAGRLCVTPNTERSAVSVPGGVSAA